MMGRNIVGGNRFPIPILADKGLPAGQRRKPNRGLYRPGRKISDRSSPHFQVAIDPKSVRAVRTATMQAQFRTGLGIPGDFRTEGRASIKVTGQGIAVPGDIINHPIKIGDRSGMSDGLSVGGRCA